MRMDLTFCLSGARIKPKQGFRMKDMKDKTFLTLSGVFFLLFFIGIAAVTFNEPISRILRASNVTPSSTKSFGIVFPQVGVAGDEATGQNPTQVKVSIYLRDNNGDVLPNRSVKLSSVNGEIDITPSDSQPTNTFGRAEFFIQSKAPQTVKLTAIDVANNTPITNLPSVEFTL
jgi:hypothetical protein